MQELKRYIIRHWVPSPVSKFKIFATSDNLEHLKAVDYESTMIVDTETGVIISNFGQRSKEYDQKLIGYERKKVKK